MTTKAVITDWFDRGRLQGATHLIVVCDTFDLEDYPVYANSDEEALEKYKENDNVNMQRVMEVYDLRLERDAQLSEHLAMHLPVPNASHR